MKVILTHDGSRTLYCDSAGQSFHSESGALSESRSVYLTNSGALQRLQNGLATSVLEIGLGTGLNYLLTADAAIRCNTSLQYVGVDTCLPSAVLLRELGYQFLVDERRLLRGLYSVLETASEAASEQDSQRSHTIDSVALRVIRDRAELAVSDADIFPDQQFDCVYLDAFSPQASPELWQSAFLEQLWRVLKPGGKLTTYCVKSTIQKRLKSVDFRVACLPGPQGGKRQVLVATK